MSLIWSIIIGAIAGFIARVLSPAPNNPRGFLLTTVLGIAGSLVATFLGRALHWYGPGNGAGLIASVIGSIIVLMIWRAVIRGQSSSGYRSL